MHPDTHTEQRMNKENNNQRYLGLQESQPTVLKHTTLQNLGNDEKGTNMNKKQP